MADGWTILTTSVQKGWNSTIGFLKKGFIRLRELVDIAGDVSVQIGGVLINALAGVETAWVETIDYLADTWSVFVAQVKSMWNSTVGFLRKAWIKLKSLFDDDVNVEVEMAKIDKEIRTADEAEEAKKQQAIGDRMKRRDARKQQIEANRVQMQEGIKQQLEERRKARAGRDIDAEMAVIDQETDAKNQVVDASRDDQFKQNEAAGQSRQQTIDDTTAGVQKTLDQMREEARVAREAGRQSPEDRAKERDQQVAAAQAEFDAAVEAANAAKPQEPEAAKEPDAGTPIPPMPAPPVPSDLKVPKVEIDGIKDPKLKPPKKKDLKLGLDRSAKDSLDQFSSGPETATEKTEAAGNFDSRGLGLGSGASLIPTLQVADKPDVDEDADAGDLDVDPQADAQPENMEVPEVLDPTKETPTNPVMQSFIYHFIGPSKPHLDRCRWQRSNPPELPFPDNRQSSELIDEWKDNPPASYNIGSIFRPDLAANLLAVYPKLLVSGTWSDELTIYDERLTSLDETFSSHLVLTRFLIRLGVNARRFKLRIKEGDDATLQLARS